MLYTTYISNLKNIPDSAIKLVVMRYPPKDLNMLIFKNLYIVQELAPSKDLMNQYISTKKTMDDWKIFKQKFIKEMNEREDIKDSFRKILKLLKNNKDVFLICCEENYIMCHRSLLADRLKLIYNINWKEF